MKFYQTGHVYVEEINKDTGIIITMSRGIPLADLYIYLTSISVYTQFLLTEFSSLYALSLCYLVFAVLKTAL